MPRYAAFLRGVTPMNLKMPQLKAAFESAGFTDVQTILSSGNVVFTSARGPASAVERKAEAAMHEQLGKSFLTIVRPIDGLRVLLERNPYQAFRIVPGAKRVITFLREAPTSKLSFPIELHGASILGVDGLDAFSAYVRTPKGPVFMTLIERTFGKDVTTRTWDTVARVAR